MWQSYWWNWEKRDFTDISFQFKCINDAHNHANPSGVSETIKYISDTEIKFFYGTKKSGMKLQPILKIVWIG